MHCKNKQFEDGVFYLFVRIIKQNRTDVLNKLVFILNNKMMRTRLDVFYVNPSIFNAELNLATILQHPDNFS